MKLLHVIDTISMWVGKIARWAALLLSLVVLYEVLSRYLFNRPTIWAFDTAMMIYSFLYLFGAAYVLWEGKHIRVDVLFNRYPKRVQAAIDVFFYLVFFFPYVVIMIWWGTKATIWSFTGEEISNTSQWGEKVWWWKMMIPAGFSFLFLQGIAEFVRSVGRVFGRENGN